MHARHPSFVIPNLAGRNIAGGSYSSDYKKDSCDEYFKKVDEFVSNIKETSVKLKPYYDLEEKICKFSEKSHSKYNDSRFADMIFECSDVPLYFNRQTAYQYARFKLQIDESKDKIPVTINSSMFKTEIMRFILMHMDEQLIDPTEINTGMLMELWIAADYYQLHGLASDTLIILNRRTLRKENVTDKFVTLFNQYWDDIKEADSIKAQLQKIELDDLQDYPIEFVIRHNNPRTAFMTWAKCNASMEVSMFNRNVGIFEAAHKELKDICDFVSTIYNHWEL